MAETKLPKKSIHVVPAAGGWVVTKPDTTPTKTYRTQREAARAAEAAIQQTGGEILIQQRDGRLRSTFTLGRTGATKLNAIEGIRLSGDLAKAFRDFDRDALTPSERRKAIARKFGKKV